MLVVDMSTTRKHRLKREDAFNDQENTDYVASRIMLNALRGPLVLAVIARKFLT